MKTIYTGEQVEDSVMTGLSTHKYPRLDANGNPLEGHGVYVLSTEQVSQLNGYKATRLQKELQDLPNQLRKSIDEEDLTVGEIVVKGDATTRGAISETLQFINELGANAPATIDWNAENGFFSIDKATLANIGIEIGKHRQKSFTAKKTLKAEIEAGTITTVEAAKTRFAELMEDYEK